jgi:hypothetical protein
MTSHGPYADQLPPPLARRVLRQGLEPDLLDDLAREAFNVTHQRGALLSYIVRRLARDAAAIGDYPTPPALTAGERAYLEDHIAEAAARLRTIVETHRIEPAVIPLRPNPDGYTHPAKVIDLAAARALRRP